MTSPSDDSPQPCAAYLARRADVRNLAEQVAALGPSRERQELRRDAAWAMWEEACELRLSDQAHALASRLAAAGDSQAAEALARAAELPADFIADVRAIAAGVRDKSTPLPTVDGAWYFARLREQLEAHRRAGRSFAQAWRIATPREGRWAVVLRSTRSSWKAAYEGEADPMAAVVGTLTQPSDEAGERVPAEQVA